MSFPSGRALVAAAAVFAATATGGVAQAQTPGTHWSCRASAAYAA